METFFAHKDAYAVLGAVGIAVCIAGPFVAYYWFQARRAEMVLSLKQSMIERGMSADEICAVMEAGESPKPDAELECPSVHYKRVRLQGSSGTRPKV
jgi:hypothetical protein